MSAVSQSYPNYLGGLNEQPDESKKPGQLVEALNVIPDPTIGLTRRPGFELVDDLSGADPSGTWFEVELSNQVNNDYIYFGNVTKDGRLFIFNQDGKRQLVRYVKDNASVLPHKEYEYDSNSGKLRVIDENKELLEEYETTDFTTNGYFRNTPDTPLKYCVSKNNIVFTNPKEVPRLAESKKPTDEEERKYYSFINLKVIDTENYNYTFRRFYGDDTTDKYTYIKEIELDSVEDLGDEYDRDLQLPLQTESPFRFELEPNDSNASVKEDAVVEVTFNGQIVQLKSGEGDGYRNEARYTWSVKIIDPGKGFKKGAIKVKLDAPSSGNSALPDLDLTFKINETKQVTATRNELIVPDDLSNNNSAEDILLELADKFSQAGIDKVLVVGSGLYLENSNEFSISTAEIAVADVLNSQKLDSDLVPIVRVNTVAELPVECYAGFIAEVTNSFDNKNNYYLEYKAESESGDDLDDPLLTKSDGYWEEIAKPFEQNNPNNGTLPHMVTIAKSSVDTEFVFVVSPIQYESRTAGTALDNPSMFIDDANITDVNYYKNRLFFLTSAGTVISSRAG